MSQSQPLSRLMSQLDAYSLSSRHRIALCVSGEQTWVESTAQPLIAAFSSSLYIAASQRGGLPASQAKQVLGQTFRCVVFNAFDGFHPNAFAAVAGCVEAGGVLVLLAPPLALWRHYDCPDYSRLAVHGLPTRDEKLFLARLADCFQASNTVWHWTQADGLVAGVVSASASMVMEHDKAYRSRDQQQAVAALESLAFGHRKRPLVLTAARGRGKSASMGIAAKRMLQQGKRVGLVAPSKVAVSEVFAFAGDHPNLVFFSPDELALSLPPLDVVLVDEAAAIPVPMLLSWAKHYSRIAFATTTQGYEGHGQGFVLRFLPALQQACPKRRQVHMVQPIRWGLGCPLEQCVNDVLMLEHDSSVVNTPVDTSPVHIRLVEQAQLYQQPALLKQVYSLLLAAHYQTTPDDLRVLLDGANVKLAITLRGTTVLAVALIAQEGGIEASLHGPIFEASRRVRGHVGPQFLAANGHDTVWLGIASWRVIRVAVLPEYRRQTLGLAILKFIEAQAREQGVEALTTVFGWTSPLLMFWHQAGFMAQVVTPKRDSVTATLSGCLVKPLSDTARDHALRGAGCFSQHWLLTVMLDAPWVSASLCVSALLLVPAEQRVSLNKRCYAILSAYVSGHKPLAACRDACQQWLVSDPATVLALPVDQMQAVCYIAVGLSLPSSVSQKQLQQRVKLALAKLRVLPCDKTDV